MSAARRAGRMMAGVGGTLVEGGMGAGIYHVHRMAAERSEFVRKQWYTGPLLLLGAGHFAKTRKSATVKAAGHVLCGVAGYAGAMAFAANEAAKKHGAQQQAAVETQALVQRETAALLGAGDYNPPDAADDMGRRRYDSAMMLQAT